MKDATCLESCPFSTAYFLAGYSNGDITLYSRNTERPLLILQNKEEIQCSSVQIIQWSKTKPFQFYAKDSRNQIHIWDLGKSDMYPEYSIKFPEEINCFRLSPQINVEGKEETAYMVCVSFIYGDGGIKTFEFPGDWDCRRKTLYAFIA